MSGPELVGIGQIVVAKAPERICCMGLGSCVAIFLYDPVAKIGGVAHALLPRAPRGKTGSGKYVDTAVKMLLEDLMVKGARKEWLRAKLIGGAQMFPNLNIKVSDIGRENTEEARRVLRGLGVMLSGEDTQGTRGRSAVFNLETGEVSVSTAFSGDHIV